MEKLYLTFQRQARHDLAMATPTFFKQKKPIHPYVADQPESPESLNQKYEFGGAENQFREFERDFDGRWKYQFSASHLPSILNTLTCALKDVEVAYTETLIQQPGSIPAKTNREHNPMDSDRKH
ncbi:hypothetical protein [Thiocystis violascens]|uniref:Uncharacterized protein n=1 Tax=Thiocystis violascens (strain ATCC 17096 / DSM 198 / 6111) TaxID=765911 RepID=I3YAB9_THIV6|nr:hypothetical protein [Thiocystis violascens]AFL73937.1 hypothetical protein Thivi_1979 [Thiocystis violascens DSM 198]